MSNHSLAFQSKNETDFYDFKRHSYRLQDTIIDLKIIIQQLTLMTKGNYLLVVFMVGMLFLRCNAMECSYFVTSNHYTIPVYFLLTCPSAAYGGEGGDQFSFQKDHPSWKVTKITVHYGTFINGIGFEMSNGTVNKSTHYERSKIYGGTEGTQKQFLIKDDDQISQIQINAGTLVDSLRFKTKNGLTSPLYGGKGGTPYRIVIPPEQNIYGLFGRSGRLIDKLGFYYGKVVKI